MSSFRIESTLDDGGNSRLDKYWNLRGFTSFYKSFRKGVDLPKSVKNLPNSTDAIERKFSIKGFQFGNWLTVEDRYNYLAALFVCFYDMNKVLMFKGNNLGLDKTLGISFGARGRSNALAHYEPSSNIINITRYKDIKGVDKMVRFKNTGGVGAVAHEYGHFLDYFFGSNYEVVESSYSLTGGNSANPKKISYPPSLKMRNIVEDILEIAYWKIPNKTKSAFFNRIKRTSTRTYFVQRNEIFARLFEQYISYQLKERGIINSFLTDTKYTEKIYMKTAELKKVIPYFDKLVREMRTYF